MLLLLPTIPVEARPGLAAEVRSTAAQATSDLLLQTRDVLGWLEERQVAARRSLDPQERRLQRFLAASVEPCAVVLLAGLGMEVGDDGPQTLLDRLLRRGPRVVVRRRGLNGLPQYRGGAVV